MNTKIHDDDYGQMERDHANALTELENLRIVDFSAANDVLMRIQDSAYQLGVQRGKKMEAQQ